MKKPILLNNWEYEVKSAIIYGFTLEVFRNGQRIFHQSGYGTEAAAKIAAIDYFLAMEFSIEPSREGVNS